MMDELEDLYTDLEPHDTPDPDVAVADELVHWPKKIRRGFAAMSPARQREIASKGGKSVPSEKRAYSRSRELASLSGKKGKGRAL